MTPADWPDEQRATLEHAHERGKVYNLLATLAWHPDAARAMGKLGGHVMGGGTTLSARDRELLILRTAWLCQAEYEWGQHVLLGRSAGLSEAEIERCRQGADSAGWSTLEASLLRAADELHVDQCIAAETWAALELNYDRRQLMDIVFTVGQYTLVAMALKSFGTPPDDGLPRL